MSKGSCILDADIWHPAARSARSRPRAAQTSGVVTSLSHVADAAWRSRYPPPSAAPRGLWALPANCGPLVVWSLLRHFRRRVRTEEILSRCRWSSRFGTFTIGMALGLSELGFTVAMYTDPDPAPSVPERRLYAVARRRHLPIRPAVPLASLLDQLSPLCIPIVFYNETGGDGHFSPFLGIRRGRLDLPYANSLLSRRAFTRRWRAGGVFRQSLLVSE
jgi:hypothetical protein